MRDIDPSLYSVAVVTRVTHLLEALTQQGPATLAALADAAGCTRTAAFRLLHTLQAEGMAMQDGARGKWRLGARLVTIGAAAAAQRAQELASLPLLRALAAETGECVYLHRRDGLEALTMAVVPADPALRIYLHAGDRRGLHAAHGRLLLGFAPAAVQRQWLGLKLPRYAGGTPTQPASIMAEAALIRGRGWLITSDELEEGEVTITVPVPVAAGAVLALAISAPALRLRPPRPRSLVAPLQSAAVHLAALLGGPPPAQPPPAPRLRRRSAAAQPSRPPPSPTEPTGADPAPPETPASAPTASPPTALPPGR